MNENKTNMYISLEDEMLKLLTIMEDRKEIFTSEYVSEKVRGALQGIPIILHPLLVHSYEMMKETYNNLDAKKEHEKQLKEDIDDYDGQRMRDLR